MRRDGCLGGRRKQPDQLDADLGGTLGLLSPPPQKGTMVSGLTKCLDPKAATDLVGGIG